MRKNDDKKLLRLVSEMMDIDDDERRVFLADGVLELDPENGFAKYIKWQSMSDDESLADTSLLREAVASLRADAENPDEYDGDGETLLSIYVSMLSDLAVSSYITGEKDTAFEAASEFMKLDNECRVMGRIVYFAILTERAEFGKLMAAAKADSFETPCAEYCRAIAAFETEGPGGEAAGYLVNAISMDPDLPYYILGLWSPVDEFGDCDEELMVSAQILSELWSATDGRLAFLSAVAFAFGYLTRRMNDADDIEMLERTYSGAGCLEEMREARDILDAMLAGGSEQEEADEAALSMLREAEYFGLLE
jgi:hypothetical protein